MIRQPTGFDDAGNDHKRLNRCTQNYFWSSLLIILLDGQHVLSLFLELLEPLIVPRSVERKLLGVLAS